VNIRVAAKSRRNSGGASSAAKLPAGRSDAGDHPLRCRK